MDTPVLEGGGGNTETDGKASDDLDGKINSRQTTMHSLYLYILDQITTRRKKRKRGNDAEQLVRVEILELQRKESETPKYKQSVKRKKKKKQTKPKKKVQKKTTPFSFPFFSSNQNEKVETREEESRPTSEKKQGKK